MTDLIELNAAEIDEVSGALGLGNWVTYLDMALEFFSGFADGVNAA